MFLPPPQGLAPPPSKSWIQHCYVLFFNFVILTMFINKLGFQ